MATALVATATSCLKPANYWTEAKAPTRCASYGISLVDSSGCSTPFSVKTESSIAIARGRWRILSTLSRAALSGDKLAWKKSLVPGSLRELPVVSSSYKVWKFQIRAKSGESKVATKPSKINFDEYMVTLEKPIGIRFAQTLSGKVYVEALAKNGNADKSRIVMVGDVLKKTSAVFGDQLWDVNDFGRTMMAIKSRAGPVSLVLERAPPVCRSTFTNSEAPFNVGRVAVTTWNNSNLIEPYQPSVKPHGGYVGFATFSSRYVLPKELHRLARFKPEQENEGSYTHFGRMSRDSGYGDEETYEVIGSFSDEDMSDGEIEWTHGSYNEEEYLSALERSEGDLIYNPARGIKYTKITEQIIVGSCIRTDEDRHLLMDRARVTAVLNLQRKSEQANWGIDGDAIERAAKEDGIVIVNCPIRDVDPVDLRRKLPYAVGVLYRLLRQGHRVYVTCTTGFDRAPACIIAYLHWIQDVALQEAVAYIKRLHPCGPDIPALVWATWDLIAMVEQGEHKGPPTHTVQFIWYHGCREGEEVLLVGEFKGGWNEPIKAVHASGPKYTVNLRLPQGKYNYKFIVGGHWRHSSNLPTEVDQWGNINNVIKIGDVASFDFDTPQRSHIKDLNTIQVIERPLTEDERFTLAFAARRMAAGIDPFTFAPKKRH
ncbi:hypothetical protein R1sor_024020 [Riccia sorocarpa]|uniref:Tyrosine-protein phosphatase domain-containing protein n=1 Tax=Riccia sorocarpa TaxID=122646 RepID=A0ABD3GV95_9MARC